MLIEDAHALAADLGGVALFQEDHLRVAESRPKRRRLVMLIEDAHALAADLGGVALFQEDHLRVAESR
ncbi:hypothetical protein C7E18_24350, partial [Stenotrophomonas maltophilia]